MYKLLQINTVVNSGSVGRIAEQLGSTMINQGWESYIAYGRGIGQSRSNILRIGKSSDIIIHGAVTRLLDRHGLGSATATRKFIKDIERLSPDIIHLHNIHGYYINYPVLFDFLKHYGAPVVWTLHDCWAFTGHCSHFTAAGCYKWRSQCGACRQKRLYPESFLLDRSSDNYNDKKQSFQGCDNLHIVVVSDWLGSMVKQSFLADYPMHRIYNGVDLDIFKPVRLKQYSSAPRPYVLGIANVWSKSKGLEDFIRLRKILADNIAIVLIGLSKRQIRELPDGIIGIPRTESIHELAGFYNGASVYINTSIEETLGMTSIEAQACGTPAIVYNSTACPETVSTSTGFIIAPHDMNAVNEAIKQVVSNPKLITENQCRHFVASKFDNVRALNEYSTLYYKLLNGK